MLLWVTVWSLFLPSTCCAGGISNSRRHDPLGAKKLGTHTALTKSCFKDIRKRWFPRAQECKLLMWSVNLVKLIHCATQQPWSKIRSDHPLPNDFQVMIFQVCGLPMKPKDKTSTSLFHTLLLWSIKAILKPLPTSRTPPAPHPFFHSLATFEDWFKLTYLSDYVFILVVRGTVWGKIQHAFARGLYQPQKEPSLEVSI